MEDKHTPGPKETWMTHGYSVYMNDDNGNTTWICDCKTKELAELIARAPELLQQVAELTKENTDLLAKVSEQEKEIEAIMKRRNKAYAELDQEREKVSEQSQRIQELTEQVEGLNKVIDVQTRMLASKQFETPELDRLREREKELIEALRARYEHLKWLKDVNTTPPSVIDEINFLQSLLSKFEESNQS